MEDPIVRVLAEGLRQAWEDTDGGSSDEDMATRIAAALRAHFAVVTHEEMDQLRSAYVVQQVRAGRFSTHQPGPIHVPEEG